MSTIQHAGNLYRRLNSATFIRYDPVADTYTFVPAAAVPRLKKLIPTAPTAEPDPARGEEQQRLALLLSAMIQHQLQASERGKPADAVPMLRLIAKSLPDSASLIRLHRIWHVTQEGFFPPEREHEPVWSNTPAVAPNANRARQILDAIIAGSPITRAHLMELAANLPAVPLAELRRAHVLVGSKVSRAWADAHMPHALCGTLLNQIHTTGGPV